MKKANTSDGYFRETFTYQGKRYSVRAKTERDLWRKVEEKKRRLEEGIDVTNENTTVDRWLANYLAAYKKGNVTDKTYHQLEAYVKNYISPAIGNRRLKDIQTIDLQLIMNSCAGKSQSQARKLRDLIRQAFKQARISRVLIFDPSEGICHAEDHERYASCSDERGTAAYSQRRAFTPRRTVGTVYAVHRRKA